MVRAQAAMEYLTIAGFLLIVIGIAFFYSTTYLGGSVDDAKTKTAVDSIAKAIDQVYALGPGSKITVNVDLPNNVQSQIVENQLVGYITTVNGSPAHYYSDTKANLRGALPLTEGLHDITLTVNDSGEVVVGETGYGLFITPKSLIVIVDANTVRHDSNIFNIKNTNLTSAGNITLTKSGTGASLISFTAPGSDLNAGQDKNVTISIDVNAYLTQAGTYNAYLALDSNNGTDRALIQIIVSQITSTPTTCTTTTSLTDTNWQTSWTVFDTNVKSQYQLINENILHWHDTRYYTQAQSDANWNKYTLLNADINWTQLQNYPTACPAGQAITQLTDTNLNCTPVGGTCTDTNWQTSWTTLDANLKATYPVKSDVNNWGDARYATLGSTTTIKVTTTDQNAQNVNTSVTGLDISLAANKHYGFHCYLTTWSNSASVGVQLAMSIPSSPNYFSAKIVGWTSTTVLAYSIVTASDSYQANTNSQGALNYVYEISGAIDNVNSGTLAPRFKSENASNVTIKAGSWCEYTQGA